MARHTLWSWLGIEISVGSFREKLISTIGGLFSIFILVLMSEQLLHGASATLIASMGASAVLLFAVPHGQLSQPWPVIGGHGLSALAGVFCARFIPHHALAAAAAVALAIGVMYQCKCIHPPGGATALTAVIGGPAIHELGWRFVYSPVVLYAAVMVGIAIVFNAAFPWRRYPAVLNRLARDQRGPAPVNAPLHDDILEALRSVDSFVDITEEDLVRLNQILRQSRKNKRSGETVSTDRSAQLEAPSRPRSGALASKRHVADRQ